MHPKKTYQLLAIALSGLMLSACGGKPESDPSEASQPLPVVEETPSITDAAILADATPLLWSEDHRDIVELAKSLVDEPAIQAARAEAIELYKASRSGQVADGLETLEATIDHLVFGSMLSTVSQNLAQPKVTWSETLPYSVGDLSVPDARHAGETPDRIYQNVALSSDYRYELKGQRAEKQSLTFIVESLPGPANWGLPPLAAIYADKIDYAEDGSFTIAMDNTPTGDRRNHLQLPEGTKSLLIRDSVMDWENHLPTRVSVVGLDQGEEIHRETLVSSSAEMIVDAAKTSLRFIDGIWAREVNQFTTYVRDLGWGIVALNPFSIADDEALIVTIDPLGAKYFTFQIDNLWLESVDYVEHNTSLNLHQAKPGADGSLTFVVSPRDPGYYNWIDTAGLNDGFLVGRWELFETATDGSGAVRSVQLVKLDDIASSMPEDAARVSAAERAQQLADRKATFNVRLGK